MNTNLEETGLFFKQEKNVLLHINNKNIRPGEIEINILNYKIKSSASDRYLGIICDS